MVKTGYFFLSFFFFLFCLPKDSMRTSLRRQSADNQRSGDEHTTDNSRSTPSEENGSYFSQQQRRRRFQFSTPISFRSFNNNSSSRTSIKSKTSWREKRINWIRQHHLPEFETKIYCNHCEKYVQTRLRYKNGSMVYLMSFILLLCTVFLFWVPFYVKYFKDVAHFCPGCGHCLGISYKL